MVSVFIQHPSTYPSRYIIISLQFYFLWHYKIIFIIFAYIFLLLSFKQKTKNKKQELPSHLEECAISKNQFVIDLAKSYGSDVCKNKLPNYGTLGGFKQ
jgi:hypothetical protein